MKPLAQNSLIQNRYLIVQLIGKGGMGEVYLAVDQRLGSAVALKRTYFAGDEMLGNAFEREARTLARMRHPVLPKVSDHFGEGEEQYLVMEHISGDDLSKRLELAQKPFPISWVLFWADQLLDALSYLHSHEPPIIHRDIKPQNLKLTDENNIILLDFGLSKTSTGMTNVSQSGSTGSVVGYTPHYAPMEQIRGIGTSARSDLYSLSATLYQLLSNTVPPDALSRADAMLNELPDPVAPLQDLNPEVSKTVSEVILKGMEVSQEKRFSDAREMQKVLRRAFTQMQEAMSAKTVAFNVSGDKNAVIVAEPIIRGTTERGGISSPRTVVDQNVPEMPAGSPVDIDFDATIPIDRDVLSRPAGESEPARIDFEPGSMVIPISDVSGQESANGEVTDASILRAYSANIVSDESDPTGAATQDSESKRSAPRPILSKPAEERTAAAGAGRSSSGKAGLVLGGLATVLLLSAVATATGWYVYTKYYSGAAGAVESAPASVTPLPEPVADPKPTLETASETSLPVNTDDQAVSTDVPDISNSDSDRPSPPAARPTGESVTRPAPVAARTPAGRTAPAQPVTKSTPKPRTPSDRTVILQ